MPSKNLAIDILKKAPVVTCPGCEVGMTLRHLEPAGNTGLYTATYRCPKCGTDSQREFTVRR